MNLQTFNPGRCPARRMLNHSGSGCYAIIHFGLNTFTDKEWGYGNENPSVFAPEHFDAEEIAKTCRECGLDGLILVCKHHDGFCLWPTSTTNYNIRQSPFRNGKGDLVKEFSDACRKYGISMGFYVSPWDRNHPEYGKAGYPAVYREQIREIFSGYGPAFEAWFDGANGGDGWYGGACETRSIDRTTYYDWQTVWTMVRSLQPDAAIFSDTGPDLRWVGNEKGTADPESYGCYTPHAPETGMEPAPGFTRSEEGMQGHPDGKYYMPPECDVPLRRGWFYHPSEDGQLRSVAELTGIYLRSVGCGGYLNLGLAPMPDGRLADGDILRLREWKKAVDALFAHPVVQCKMPLRDGAGIIEFGRPARFNLLEMAEQIADGEKIRGYEVLLRTAGGGFRSLISGKAIGRRRLKRLPETVEGDAIQIRITDAAAPVAALRVACYAADFPEAEKECRHSPPDYLRTAHHPEGTEWHCDLGCEMPVKGFRFTPDPGLPAGTPDRYELLLSSDGRTWRSVAAGEFSNIRANPLPCTVTFRQTEHARFCRLRATRMLIPGETLAGVEFGILTALPEERRSGGAPVMRETEK